MEFLKKLQWIISKKISSFGVNIYQQTDDRHILETAIFPFFLKHSEFINILFVGCDWYTRGYNKKFRRKVYSTLEIDPEKSRYGADRHIIDSLENVSQYFEKGELDAIICNGVFGWGLDDIDAVEKAFHGCYECLRTGGILVLGWNDVDERRPFPLSKCQSLKLFDEYIFPPLSTSKYLANDENRHIYNFYIKGKNK